VTDTFGAPVPADTRGASTSLLDLAPLRRLNLVAFHGPWERPEE
jgi:hypothetical protein